MHGKRVFRRGGLPSFFCFAYPFNAENLYCVNICRHLHGHTKQQLYIKESTLLPCVWGWEGGGEKKGELEKAPRK